MHKRGGGFTLAELLIVVAVIAVLVAVAVPTFGSQLEKSRQSADVANLRDAYAVAKLAVLNQDDPDPDASDNEGAKYLNNLKNSAVDKELVAVYIDPDNGNFYSADKKTLQIGKATGERIITDQYPSAVIYNANTANKSIIGEFVYGAKSRTFTLSTVKFANELASNNAEEVVMIAGSSAPSVSAAKAKVGVSVGTAKTISMESLFSFYTDTAAAKATDLAISGTATVTKDNSTFTQNAATVQVDVDSFQIIVGDAAEAGKYETTLTVTGKNAEGSDYVTKVDVELTIAKIGVEMSANGTAVEWDLGQLAASATSLSKDLTARYSFTRSNGKSLATGDITWTVKSAKEGAEDMSTSPTATAGVVAGTLTAGKSYVIVIEAESGSTSKEKATITLKCELAAS